MTSADTKKIITEEMAAQAFMNQITQNLSTGFAQMIERLEEKWLNKEKLDFDIIRTADHFLAMEIALGLSALPNIYPKSNAQSIHNLVMTIAETFSQTLQKSNKQHANISQLITNNLETANTSISANANPIEKFSQMICDQINLSDHTSSTEIQLYIYMHFTAIEVWKGIDALFKLQTDTNISNNN